MVKGYNAAGNSRYLVSESTWSLEISPSTSAE